MSERTLRQALKEEPVGQTGHMIGWAFCRLLHGKRCPHIGGLGTWRERWMP